MYRCLLLRESRKLFNERNFSYSRQLQRVKFNKEVHGRNKQVIKFFAKVVTLGMCYSVSYCRYFNGLRGTQ